MSIFRKARKIYCEETTGGVDVCDSWKELSSSVQLYYLKKADDEKHSNAITREQHLLACLAEEASEVIQQIGKITRFGMDDKHPDLPENNKERFITAYLDFQSILDMLVIDHILPYSVLLSSQDKIWKTEKYIKYAYEKGMLI